MRALPERSSRMTARDRWRLLGTGAASILGVALCLASGVSSTLGLRNPAIAAKANPLDGAAIAALADQALENAGDRGTLAEAADQARRAILLDGVSARAIRVLGYVADSNGNDRQAVRMMHHSQRLSRRDLLTQIWLAEARIEANDAKGALRHHDIALRTSRIAPGILFPILANAAKDPSLLSPIAGLLASAPPWRYSFLTHLLNEQDDPSLLHGFALQLRKMGSPVAPAEAQAFAVKLAAADRFDLAWSIQSPSFSGNFPTARVGRFVSVENALPFTWQFRSDQDYGSEVSDAEANRLNIYASGQGGEVARHLLSLPTGRYSLSVGVATPSEFAGAKPAWTIQCAGREGKPLANLAFAENGLAAERKKAAMFEVPAGCPQQWLLVQSGTPRAGEQSSVEFEGLSLRRLAREPASGALPSRSGIGSASR